MLSPGLADPPDDPLYAAVSPGCMEPPGDADEPPPGSVDPPVAPPGCIVPPGLTDASGLPPFSTESGIRSLSESVS